MKHIITILLISLSLLAEGQNYTPMHYIAHQKFDSLITALRPASATDSIKLRDAYGLERHMSIGRLGSLIGVNPGGETLQSVTSRDSSSNHLATFSRGINAFNSGAADAPPLYSKVEQASSFSVYNIHSLGITNTGNRTARWNFRGASLPTSPGSQDSVYNIDYRQKGGTVAYLPDIRDTVVSLAPLKDGTGATGFWNILAANATNAQNATYWGGRQADFSSGGSGLSTIVGFPASGPAAYYVNTQVRDWLAIPDSLSKFVRLTGNQTVAGDKVFTGYITIAPTSGPFSIDGTSGYTYINLINGANYIRRQGTTYAQSLMFPALNTGNWEYRLPNKTIDIIGQQDLTDSMNNVVRIFGAQTIAGAKTFTDNITISKLTPLLSLRDGIITQSLKMGAGTSGEFAFPTTAGGVLVERSQLPSVFTGTTTATVTNTTAQTSIVPSGVGTMVIPAGISAGKTYRLVLSGLYNVPMLSPGNLTIRVKIGATTVAYGTITSFLAGASDAGFTLQNTLTFRTVGASGSVMATGSASFVNGSMMRGFADINNGSAATTINTTVSNTIDVTVQWSAASGSNSISILNATLEQIN